MFIRTFTTDRGDHGRRLDQVLRRHLADLDRATRSRLQRWIEEGAVTVNDRQVARSASRVAPGNVVSISLPQSAHPARLPLQPDRIDLDMLFEDEHLLVVNKPPGLVVHPTHAHATGTLMNALLWRARSWPGAQRPSIVGRLDKLTSGIVVVAKTASMHAALQRAMAAAACEKDYLGIVYGRVTPMYGHIDLRLARDTVDRRRMTTSEPDGAASLTLYARIAQTPARAGGLALVRCRLVTGRTHQIRAHLAAKGWPLVGDRVYGEPRRAAVPVHALAETLRAFSRQALHAWRLGLVHPVTRTRLEVEAPVPADLDALMTAIGWRSSILCRVGRALR